MNVLYHVRKSSKMYQENLLNNDLNLASFCYVYCATQHITTIITTRNSDFICQLILKSKIFIKMFSKEQKIWIVENNSLSSTDLRRKFWFVSILFFTDSLFVNVTCCAVTGRTAKITKIKPLFTPSTLINHKHLNENNWNN